LLGAALFLLPLTACQKDDLLKPGDVESNVLVVGYVSDAEFAQNPIELDGEALAREWGGALDPERPILQVRVSREDGAGDPGDPLYVSIKAVYTQTHLYMLFQWADDDPNVFKDALEYIGEDLRFGSGCYPPLATDASWRRLPEDEDRLSVVFEMEPSGDDLGSFAEQGCQTACHVGSNPTFGGIDRGRLDVWQWLSTRTNPPRDLFERTENPNFPLRGYPGYLEDYVIDAQVGLAPDPGSPSWRLNTAEGTRHPIFVYKVNDDIPFGSEGCRNEFQADCLKNNGLDEFYLFRDNVTNVYAEFSECDTLNEAVLPQGREPRRWKPAIPEIPGDIGDLVTGYWYTYARGSRADVKGKGAWSDDEFRWTLEIGRRLDTGNPADDVIFAGEPGEEIPFAIAIFDNSGAVHRGSVAQVLRFGPKTSSATARHDGEVPR